MSVYVPTTQPTKSLPYRGYTISFYPCGTIVIFTPSGKAVANAATEHDAENYIDEQLDPVIEPPRSWRP